MAHKIQKKHFKSLAVIASVTALIVISSTMAYFTSKDNTTNKFVGSRFDVMLLETKWDPEKAKNVIPGEELDKNPQITNTERANCYVYLRVTVPCDTTMVDKADGTPMGETGAVPMYKFMIKDSEKTPMLPTRAFHRSSWLTTTGSLFMKTARTTQSTKVIRRTMCTSMPTRMAALRRSSSATISPIRSLTSSCYGTSTRISTKISPTT